MAKKAKISEPEAGTMEDYIFRLIGKCTDRLNDKDNPLSFPGFQYYVGARNFLIMALAGHTNTLANPKPTDENPLPKVFDPKKV